MRHALLWPTLAIPALTVSCARPDPLADDARAYAAAMAPVLEDNMAVNRTYLAIAGQVKKGGIDGDALHGRFEGEILPRSKELLASARAIAPATPQFTAVHGQIVDAWDHRVSAYDELLAAWTADDLAAWDEAAKANLQAKLEEERYFDAANALLKPYDLWLDAYPAEPAVQRSAPPDP